MTWSDITEFSGIWMVQTVSSIFQGGFFKQVLKCSKIMGQKYDVGFNSDPGNSKPTPPWFSAGEMILSTSA